MREKEEEEEEEVKPKHRGFNPDWFGDTYTAAFRAVSTPHSGAQSVRSGDTIGAADLCWCGQPLNHGWPGKDQGVLHPIGANMLDAKNLDRSSLRGYHRTIQDFILHEVGVNGLNFRFANNAIILYPPDGTQPITVFNRNTEKQLRSLTQWHTRHVQPSLVAGDTHDEVKRLAEVLNDPVEHPAPEPAPQAPEPAPEPPQQPITTPAETTPAGFVPYYGAKGQSIDGIYTNGDRIICTLCAGTSHPLDSTNFRSIGGHRRMWHSSKGSRYLWQGDESSPLTADDRAERSRARNENSAKKANARQAIDALCAIHKYYPVDPDHETSPDSGLMETLTKRAEEAETRLALMREALSL